MLILGNINLIASTWLDFCPKPCSPTEQIPLSQLKIYTSMSPVAKWFDHNNKWSVQLVYNL